MLRHERGRVTGFTIVELLIVVVVIAILAAVTIVAYNGIQGRAKDSAVASSVSQATKKIEAFKSASTTETYPTTPAEAGISGINGLTFLAGPDKANYCVQVANGTTIYSATKDAPTPAKIPCSENGLTAWWQLNGDGADSTGNGWPLTTSGVAGQGQDNQAGTALSFSGSYPAATVNSSESLLPASHTFSFWYNASAWNSGAATSFIGKRAGALTGLFVMRLTASGTLVIDCAGQNNRWNTGAALPLNTWTHIVVTCSNTAVSAYVNGVSVGSTALSAGVVANNTLLQFAQDGSQYSLTGRMDDIRLFNRALGSGEAQNLFTAGAR